MSQKLCQPELHAYTGFHNLKSEVFHETPSPDSCITKGMEKQSESPQPDR
jgi:hypothetical protein